MKLSSRNEENNNLVMFPASKNYKIDISDMDLGADPLNDLINEFSHVKEEDLPDFFDPRFEDELDNNDSFDSLETFMARSQTREFLTPDDILVNHINGRLAAINDLKARIKFYLDELEMFLPARRG